MSRFAIELLTNLKVSSELTVPKGQSFSGSFEELPNYIRSMMEEKSSSIIVRELPEELPVVEIPEEKPVAEVPEKPVVKTTVKRTTRKKITK